MIGIAEIINKEIMKTILSVADKSIIGATKGPTTITITITIIMKEADSIIGTNKIAMRTHGKDIDSSIKCYLHQYLLYYIIRLNKMWPIHMP